MPVPPAPLLQVVDSDSARKELYRKLDNEDGLAVRIKWPGAADMPPGVSYFDGLPLEEYVLKWGMREMENDALHRNQVGVSGLGGGAGQGALLCPPVRCVLHA